MQMFPNVLLTDLNFSFFLLDVDKIICDVNSTVEAQSGENLTIHCRTLPNAQYTWIKVSNDFCHSSDFHLIHIKS